MRPIYFFFMGMMTGIAIIGVEFICIISIHKVIDRFQIMDYMGREVERLKWRQGIIEGKLKDLVALSIGDLATPSFFKFQASNPL